MIIGGIMDLKGSQNGKFHGMITTQNLRKLRDLSMYKILLTKGGPKWLMSYNSALVRIDDIKLLVCNESLSIIDIPLEMRDTLINLSLGLRDRLSHLLGHQLCVFSFIFLQDLLQIS